MTNIEIILETVSNHFGVTVRGLRNSDTSKLLITARIIAFRLMEIHEPMYSKKELIQVLNKPKYMICVYHNHFTKYISNGTFLNHYTDICQDLSLLPINSTKYAKSYTYTRS